MTCGAPVCFGRNGRFCEICERRARYGVIVEALCVEGDEPPFALTTLAALDAIADVMTDRHRLIRAHRRELHEEARAAQRGANGAYYEGYANGREQGGGGW